MPCFDLSGEPSTCDTVGSSAFDVPDRLTGYSALSELNPQRQWNFVEVSTVSSHTHTHTHTNTDIHAHTHAPT